MQVALPHMKQRSAGRIVTIASIGGLVAIPHQAPYSASKFALVGLSDTWRDELAKDGIRITSVCPGLMRTGSQCGLVQLSEPFLQGFCRALEGRLLLLA